MQAVLLVGLGGALGAMARYGVGRFVAVSGFPVATFIINVSGSFLMGLLVGMLLKYTPSWSIEARLLLGTGVLGGFTTFSTFSLETIELIERGQWGWAAGYVGMSVFVSVVALALGLWVARGGI